MPQVQSYRESFRCLSRFSCLCLLLFQCHEGVANSCPMDVIGGSVQPLAEGKSNVEMFREDVIVDLKRDSYTVDATFELHNHGKRVKVLLGFPEETKGSLNYDYYPIEGVVCEIAGKPVPISRKPGQVTVFAGSPFENVKRKTLQASDLTAARKLAGETSKKSDTELYVQGVWWHVNEVEFSENEVIKERFTYRQKYWETSSGDGMNCRYIFGSGRPWYGTITTARFVVRTSPDVWMLSIPKTTHNRPVILNRIGEYEYEIVWRDLEPQDDEVLVIDCNRKSQAFHDMATFVYDCTPIPEWLLPLLSLRQLDLLRDHYLASNGQRFKDKERSSYFSGLFFGNDGDRPYAPTTDNAEPLLTAVQRDNVTRIDAYKQELMTLLAKNTGQK